MRCKLCDGITQVIDLNLGQQSVRLRTCCKPVWTSNGQEIGLPDVLASIPRRTYKTGSRRPV